MAEIKAVIFDWGGVLIDDPAPGCMKYCADAFGVTPEEFSGVYKRYWRLLEVSAIEEREMWQRVASELGRTPPSVNSLWSDAFRHAYSPKEEMFVLADSLHKNGYRVGLLSNAETACADFFDEQKYQMFDAAVFSGREKVSKRGEIIFKTTCQRLGVRPPEAAFVDNVQDYVDIARSVGMYGILFTSPEQTREGLVSLGARL